MKNQLEITEMAIEFLANKKLAYPKIWTEEATAFIIELHKKFESQRKLLLLQREQKQVTFDQGIMPVFIPETKSIRESNWTAGEIPKDLQDRRVEITGPVDRKMIINALNSDAKTFMADFEDSTSPTWQNLMDGQVNLIDAVNKTITFTDLVKQKSYHLNEKIATLIVRPRGLHLPEKHVLIEGKEVSGSLVDFGLYVFHNHKRLLENNSGPYFYIPKLEHYLEARWWNTVIDFTEDYLNLKRGTIKVTVLIETITASFQLDEIIYELKEHIVGLNCGRWDYIFSYIKKFRKNPKFIVPDRDQVTMISPFMNAYSNLVIQRCHKRSIHAIGGMAAQIPIRNNEEANAVAFAKVKTDKEREVRNGHDGTWVAHPDLVAIAKEVFDKGMPTPNQIHVKGEHRKITEADLIEPPIGLITENGVRKNINVAVLYLASWLTGQGAAALHNLMEDAATAEISRSQLWQWLQNKVILDNGRKLDLAYYHELALDEFRKIKEELGVENHEKQQFPLAEKLLERLVVNLHFVDFLTIPCYKYL
ncbi:malate synthase A [Flavobacterium sharifuzzamanii]|uniref:malate synthase A n=1 Tax=Flavobacterium sharifuzzamanii TaxID=2211133 RepID=UPI000DABD36D|nr:malate synthase A [Flavobacterium sharifuzzamanii]KAF2082660.1 malate synthase A [Flavobacterium sharifuzzamanii]